MNTTTKQLIKIINNKPVNNEFKLVSQQKYYERLQKIGVAKKQTYNLKPISAI